MYKRDNRSLVIFAVAVTVVLCCLCLMARLLVLWLSSPTMPIAGFLPVAPLAAFAGYAPVNLPSGLVFM